MRERKSAKVPTVTWHITEAEKSLLVCAAVMSGTEAERSCQGRDNHFDRVSSLRVLTAPKDTSLM